MVGVTRLSIGVLLALVLTGGLLFGSMAHASLDHVHSHDAVGMAIAESMHSAARHEEKDISAFVGVAALYVVSLLVLVCSSFLTLPAALHIEHRGKVEDMLIRGSAAYRHFS